MTRSEARKMVANVEAMRRVAIAEARRLTHEFTDPDGAMDPGYAAAWTPAYRSALGILEGSDGAVSCLEFINEWIVAAEATDVA